MKEDIRETIKKDLLNLIKKASTEEERAKIIYNFQEFTKTLYTEASILELMKR